MLPGENVLSLKVDREGKYHNFLGLVFVFIHYLSGWQNTATLQSSHKAKISYLYLAYCCQRKVSPKFSANLDQPSISKKAFNQQLCDGQYSFSQHLIWYPGLQQISQDSLKAAGKFEYSLSTELTTCQSWQVKAGLLVHFWYLNFSSFFLRTLHYKTFSS